MTSGAAKAQQVFRALRRPLIVEDSGFGIDEVGGYPGPMVKHLLSAVGAVGIERLADLTQTRVLRLTSRRFPRDSADATCG